MHYLYKCYASLSKKQIYNKSKYVLKCDMSFYCLLDVSTTILTNFYFLPLIIQQTVKMVLIVKKNVLLKRFICFRHDNFVDVNQIPVV